MALEDFLNAAAFNEVELFGQFPRFQYPYRYCMFDASENALVQAFPSDRPNAWYVAVLNFVKGTLDYGMMPRLSDTVLAATRQYCFDGLRLFSSSGFFWTRHPWAGEAKQSAIAVQDYTGVPGVTQFLTEFPYCEPTELNGNSSPIGAGRAIPKLALSRPERGAGDYNPDDLHERVVSVG